MNLICSQIYLLVLEIPPLDRVEFVTQGVIPGGAKSIVDERV